MNNDIKAINSGVFRKPRKGEWFLSDAIPEAYRAPNDLSQKYFIANLIRLKQTILTEIIKTYKKEDQKA